MSPEPELKNQERELNPRVMETLQDGMKQSEFPWLASVRDVSCYYASHNEIIISTLKESSAFQRIIHIKKKTSN